jgi:hypothetical protein
MHATEEVERKGAQLAAGCALFFDLHVVGRGGEEGAQRRKEWLSQLERASGGAAAFLQRRDKPRQHLRTNQRITCGG